MYLSIYTSHTCFQLISGPAITVNNPRSGGRCFLCTAPRDRVMPTWPHCSKFCRVYEGKNTSKGLDIILRVPFKMPRETVRNEMKNKKRWQLYFSCSWGKKGIRFIFKRNMAAELDSNTDYQNTGVEESLISSGEIDGRPSIHDNNGQFPSSPEEDAFTPTSVIYFKEALTSASIQFAKKDSNPPGTVKYEFHIETTKKTKSEGLLLCLITILYICVWDVLTGFLRGAYSLHYCG